MPPRPSRHKDSGYSLPGAAWKRCYLPCTTFIQTLDFALSETFSLELPQQQSCEKWNTSTPARKEKEMRSCSAWSPERD